jgi:hypothetical protein
MESLVNTEFDSTWEEDGAEDPTGQVLYFILLTEAKQLMRRVSYTKMILECVQCVYQFNTGWRRETVKFEIIRKKTKETYKTLFDLENVFYKSGNFIRHHFLKITSVKCCPFCS